MVIPCIKSDKMGRPYPPVRLSSFKRTVVIGLNMFHFLNISKEKKI